ncbi:MAG: peptidase M3 [Proteobacteria bacterium]|nr:peptidase M3 [Pseudomonadota bacterium]
MNPFLSEFETPYGVPPFDLIRFEHFKPAFAAGFAQQVGEYEDIEDNPEEPTFENTMVALERSGATLNRVARVFYNLLGTDTTEDMSELAKEVGAQIAAHRNRLYLSQKMYRRVDVLHKNPDPKWDSEQLRLIAEIHRKFVRAGVQLEDDQRKRLSDIDEEIATLSSQYRENLLSESNESTILITDIEDLEGVPKSMIEAAAELANKAGHSNTWLFKANRTTLYPFLTYAKSRTHRKSLYAAYLNRARRGNEQDNAGIAQEIATLRVEKANILGFSNYASYILLDSMAKEPQKVLGFLDQIWEAALASAKKDASLLQNKMNRNGVEGELKPWDWWHYAEQVRTEQFDFREEEVKPYFSTDLVLKGAMSVASKLFKIQFKERTDLPTYHTEVRTFEVLTEESSNVIGILYIDYYARASKRGGAWMSSYQVQSTMNGPTIPVVINVCNFPPPTQDSPSLLSSGEVKTLFHELGHALHGLLSSVRYPSLSGTSVVRDYVEFPSQLMENWGRDPQVVPSYAVHYETKETIPSHLLEKMAAASNFNQGFVTTEYLAASYLDLAWHLQEGPSKTADEIEQEVIERIGLIPEIAFRYRSTYFSHIFAGGYSSYYYCYIWAAVLEKDAYALFEEKGLFDESTAAKLLEHVYSRGNTKDPMGEYRLFRGSEPSVEALIEKRGLRTE